MREPPPSAADAGEVADAAPERRPYTSPRISWQEPYEPMSFGISCAKQPGNPPCNTGPHSS